MTGSRPTLDHLGYCPDCEYLGDHPHPPAPETEGPAPVGVGAERAQVGVGAERAHVGVAAERAHVGAAVVATVVFLTAIAPLATDMYVPAFPAVAAELLATATQVQLTLTTFFVGMALGQLGEPPLARARRHFQSLRAAEKYLSASGRAASTCDLGARVSASAVIMRPQSSARMIVWSRSTS